MVPVPRLEIKSPERELGARCCAFMPLVVSYRKNTTVSIRNVGIRISSDHFM